jgi:hypothetical protein
MADNPLFPKVLALVVADYTHTDPRTGANSLYNVFDGLAAPSFPVAKALAVFLQLTNLRAPSSLRLRLIDADEERPPLLERDFALPALPPLHVQSVALNDAVIFPAPGSYRLQLLAGDELLLERALDAKLVGGLVPPRT